MTRVLVTGAAGNVGAHAVRELRERGASVRAFVRDPGRAAQRLGGDVELAAGDFEDPASLRRAMAGVDRVFVVSANGPGQAAQENAVIDAAAAAWVERIVKLSVFCAEPGAELMFADAHGRVERRLGECDVPSTVLRSGFFMSNLVASADAIRATGQLFAPLGDAKIAMIDPRDVAAAAAAALVADRLGRQTYVVTGPQAITYAEVAAELSAATGRAVGFVDVPEEAARAGMLESGLPGWFADAFVLLCRVLRAGGADQATGDFRLLTGREPRPFADFAHDHRQLFAG
jgi:uncharacterized protein YbjT (DUF2867 family)